MSVIAEERSTIQIKRLIYVLQEKGKRTARKNSKYSRKKVYHLNSINFNIYKENSQEQKKSKEKK